jgi:hypothetical protein
MQQINVLTKYVAAFTKRSNRTFGFIFVVLVVTVIIIIIISSLVTVFSPCYFSSLTNGDPHRSGFKFQTAVPSVLRVMFQVQLSFVVNLLNVLLLWLTNLSLSLLLLFLWLQLLPV